MIVHDHEYIDFSVVPQSKGMSKAGLIFIVVGIIGIFIMGGLSVCLSGYGHVWPSERSERVNLGTMTH